ncbi:MAG: hypothetical protein HOI66_08665 [Verrucomicrobia bacterium]|jgi:hypothetical protein|nr:hypothetical protein [Verrucomicrobiota bacterium]MDA7510501.1 hypothetical protein [Verrucomicrobiota bacterium]
MNRNLIKSQLITVLLTGVMGLFLVACSTAPKMFSRVPAYVPQNVVTNQVAMDRVVQRVAVLPIVFLGDYSDRQMTTEMFSGILESELVKRGAFEPYFVTGSALNSLTGSAKWRLGEKIPADFFETISEEFQCQAVLFTVVNHYHPYPPQTVAWRMKLIDSKSQETIWEIDELFDSGNVTVAQAANEHYILHQSGGTRHRDERSVLNSPRRFCQYTAFATLETLPY